MLRHVKRQEFFMNRNGLYAVIAILLIAVVGFAIYTYQQQTRPGIEVRVDEQGISIDGNG
ncbi:hypothetical protein ASD80_07730 [Devosia sp. Root635]|nr:hypothetical protein ASD80_07730 [Devosia sp. Root635]